MKQSRDKGSEQTLLKIEKGSYAAIALAAVWSILSYVLFGFEGLLAVIVTLVAVVIFVVAKGLAAKREESQQQSKVELLESKLLTLSAELKGEQASRAALETKIRVMEQQGTLDCKYYKTLVCLQRIDDMFRNLDANIASPNFERNVRLAMDEVFGSYGYRFEDYTEQTKHLYECEYQPIEAPEVVFRAITRADGTVAVKGKIFLPLE